MGDVLDRLSTSERLAISNLFRDKAAALPHHKAQVKLETAKGNPTHSITRHGYQTGWESQLMRLVTGRTPDQPDDEDGVRDAVQKFRTKEALSKKEQGKITYAPADSVGAFLSPEVEHAAISLARAKAAPLLAYTQAETSSKSGLTWTPYDYIDMVVAGPHKLTGVSFNRAKNAVPLVQADAVQAIEDFIGQRRVGPPGSTDTWGDKKRILEIMEESDHAAPYTRSSYRQDYKLRFPTMSDLLAYLSVTAVWMKHVNVVLRRFGPGDWRLHTAYCVHCPEFPSPLRGGPSVKTGKWTGNVRAGPTGAAVFVDPALLA
ncbi:hypothetical protein [Variovorax sp. dw_954]|uniref:hypothetical protein n=1 Tax=Variovorax sp. dw_954 TaxID=2720078 RepID=UPI001BD284BF|nr:hypothetical protein [Variovorax sp. dw_954]